MTKAYNEYSKAVRKAVRDLWRGDIDVYEFIYFMSDAMESGFEDAWIEGAEYLEVPPDLNYENRDIIATEVAAKSTLLLGFGGTIIASSKDEGGKLAPLLKRAALWTAAYFLIREFAKTVLGEDIHLKWTLHPAEHCRSCVKLDGIVKTATEWQEQDVYPRHWDKLDCRIGCKCTLDKTDEPVTEAPLPLLP